MKPKAYPARIGSLEYNSKLDQYCGTVALGELVVDVTFDMDGQNPSKEFISLGEAFLSELASLHQSASNHVCDQMLGLKNSTWLRPNETPLSETEFKSRLKLYGAWLNSDGSRLLTFRDGGLFWGHDIMLDIDPDGKFQEPYLFG